MSIVSQSNCAEVEYAFAKLNLKPGDGLVNYTDQLAIMFPEKQAVVTAEKRIRDSMWTTLSESLIFHISLDIPIICTDVDDESIQAPTVKVRKMNMRERWKWMDDSDVFKYKNNKYMVIMDNNRVFPLYHSFYGCFFDERPEHRMFDYHPNDSRWVLRPWLAEKIFNDLTQPNAIIPEHMPLISEYVGIQGWFSY